MASVTLSIVVPMYNESEGIDVLFERLTAVLVETGLDYEVVCVNDGSADDTLERLTAIAARDPHVVVVDLARNFGKEPALTAGIDHARGEAVIPIDADLQDPPELILEMVAKWREGFDVVYAKRRARRGESFAKLASANLFYRTINAMSDIPIPENTGDYRLMDRRVVDALKQLPERTRFMKGLFAWVGFRQTSVEFDRDPRAAGETKWNYSRLWRFALDGITSFSSFPLRFLSYFGLLIAAAAFGYMTFLIVDVITHGKDVPGYASLIVVVLFLGGLQMLALGTLGEYIGRIFVEVKQRPTYIVREIQRGSTVTTTAPPDLRRARGSQ